MTLPKLLAFGVFAAAARRACGWQESRGRPARSSIRYEGDTLTFTTDTATIEGVINPDDPIEGAVVKAENKSTGESYGRDETDADGQYAFENISGLEIGQMLELLVDAKRPDEDENLSTVLAPTVGEPET